MLINCQNCQKIVSSYRENCPHCNEKAVCKNDKKFFSRFGKIFNGNKIENVFERNFKQDFKKNI